MLILPAPLDLVTDDRQNRRAARFTGRRFLHRWSSLKRLRFCGVDPVQGRGGVTVKASGKGKDRRAGYGQLQHCGSTWSCPVCSHKINAVRAAELAAAVSAWHAPVFGPAFKKGPKPQGRIVFLTLTMRHRRADLLDDMWTNGVSAAWNAVTSGRPWLRDQDLYGSLVSRKVKTGKHAGKFRHENRIGFARVVETTHGDNGWHVHIHALLFVRGTITGDEALLLGDSMFGRWLPALEAAGFHGTKMQHGVDVKLIGPDDSNKVSDYFTKNSFEGKPNAFGQANAGKVGWEAAGGTGKSGRKKNRTPFQILADAAANGVDSDGVVSDDLALWWVWESASKGKRQMTWSPWLRDWLKLGEEADDNKIANTDMGGDVVLRLRADQFDAIIRCAEGLLDAVEADDDMTAAHAWLDRKLGLWRTELVIDDSGPLPFVSGVLVRA